MNNYFDALSPMDCLPVPMKQLAAGRHKKGKLKNKDALASSNCTFKNWLHSVMSSDSNNNLTNFEQNEQMSQFFNQNVSEFITNNTFSRSNILLFFHHHIYI